MSRAVHELTQRIIGHHDRHQARAVAEQFMADLIRAGWRSPAEPAAFPERTEAAEPTDEYRAARAALQSAATEAVGATTGPTMTDHLPPARESAVNGSQRIEETK